MARIVIRGDLVRHPVAGRPVVLPDTGFSDWLPTGEGVWSFTSVDRAAAALPRPLARSLGPSAVPRVSGSAS